MGNSNKKSRQLGMAHGTAANKLRKAILFSLVVETERDNCHRCGKKIANVNALSIEHIEPWLNSNNPTGLYFDLENIAFSHTACNYGATRQTRKGKSKIGHGTDSKYHMGCRCSLCKSAHTKATQGYRLGD